MEIVSHTAIRESYYTNISPCQKHTIDRVKYEGNLSLLIDSFYESIDSFYECLLLLASSYRLKGLGPSNNAVINEIHTLSSQELRTI